MNAEQKVAIADRLMGEFGLDRETVARMIDAARFDVFVGRVVGTGFITNINVDAGFGLMTTRTG